MLHSIDLLYATRRGPVFAKWMGRMLGGGPVQACELVEALGSPWRDKPGLPDNVADAKHWLRAARKEGLIVPDRLNPSLSQRFFGVPHMGSIDKAAEWVERHGVDTKDPADALPEYFQWNLTPDGEKWTARKLWEDT